jgi:hypothetical protein
MRKKEIIEEFDGGKVIVLEIDGRPKHFEVTLHKIIIDSPADIDLRFDELSTNLATAKEIVKHHA